MLNASKITSSCGSFQSATPRSASSGLSARAVAGPMATSWLSFGTRMTSR
jgi:hypothetical protein